MKQIKIIIVDDHKIVREGLAALLMFEKSINIIGQASSGEEFFNMLSEKKIPDIVLLDIAMPGMSGLDVAEKTKREHPEIKIIMLTGEDSKTNVAKSVKFGVEGFVLKETGHADLINAIGLVSEGELFFDKNITIDAFKHYLKDGKAENDQDDLLSEREVEIIKLLSEGFPHKEIAEILSISKRTVDTHVQNIKRKLNLHSKTDIINYAIKNNLFSL